ncbi:MAG: glutamate synthase, partial [Clostridia bacterium]|nr:glutamate synthase [Clostridia bacterium]
HGGKMFLRSDCRGIKFPNQVHVEKALGDNLLEITDYIEEFCQHFGYNKDDILKSEFTIITPDSKNPYKQMYVPN